MKDDGFAESPPIKPSKLVWSYGGYQYDPTRRVSVSPNMMLLNTLSVTLEARGVLLTVFCRYWLRDVGPECEHVRLEHRLSKRKFGAILSELLRYQLIRQVGDTLVPALSFGPDESVKSLPPASGSKRSVPTDWAKIRDEVFARDRFACVYCGSGRDLHCDHIYPVVLGGGHETENLATACATCNLSKGGKTLAEWRPDIAEAWGR